VKEQDFLRQVRELAKTLGWRIYHHPYSLGADPGFPDLVLVHPKKRRLVFAELKGPRGKISDSQWAWIEDLAAAGAEVYVWFPSDWDEVVEVLEGKRPRQKTGS
jgi:hypothetical protein